MATQTLVIGLDGSAGASAALDWVIDHAQALEASVVVVHSIDIPPLAAAPLMVGPPMLVTDELIEELRVEAERWCEPLRAAGVPYRVEVREGSPAGAINSVAAREHAALIVVGRRGHGGFLELVLGSVPHALAHSARVPLVIVPAPEA